MRPIDADLLELDAEYDDGEFWAYSKRQIEEAPTLQLNALLSAQTERKPGRWERHNTYHGDDTSGYIDPDWRCSECGRQANVNEFFMYDLTDFCPNCGADMRGEDV